MLNVIYMFFSVIGFGIIFNLPMKMLPLAALSAAVGQAGYTIIMDRFQSPVAATVLSAIIIGLLGEVMARTFKKPATLFVIPGILPLVPGAYIYQTMLYLVQDNIKLAIEYGLLTGFVSLGIAASLMAVTTFWNLIFNKK
ncbi:threonine/serine exporter family protein [Calorimonas adulescens]|jgi:hypothetical protein|uniref:Threonine/serine exporter n=1 Tax=Calorimonas adulescens TaxID=2606906 RepID=A0A5D8QF06_9THEO|nr:threonine/serine exporter family protein [Calorimonas adulescens]TZE82416.1 threonine/serine exporter [Calorimonas adulescens]